MRILKSVNKELASCCDVYAAVLLEAVQVSRSCICCSAESKPNLCMADAQLLSL